MSEDHNHIEETLQKIAKALEMNKDILATVIERLIDLEEDVYGNQKGTSDTKARHRTSNKD